MKLDEAKGLSVGDKVTIREDCADYQPYSLRAVFLGLEWTGGQWEVRVRHPRWMEGKSLAYPIRMAHR